MSSRREPLANFIRSVAYLYSTISNVVDPNAPIIADTNYGELRGTASLSRVGRSYYEFLGVPYASPPIGDLRYEPPLPPEKWKGLRDATRYGSRCTQYDYITRSVQGDENCLFLNIFTHKVVKKGVSNSTLYPVMVYIHGGLFMTGMSNAYRAKYFMDESIVLVTINYRLNSFGFLSTGDEHVRGNMGLKDQSQALRWVQENIKYFGGDPNYVTICGESAGGSAVHFHILSPMSKGLFQRAISQSGTALSQWALESNPKKQAKMLAKKLNCPTDSSEAIVKCLKKKSAKELAEYHSEYPQNIMYDRLGTFTPTVEGVNDTKAFLIRKPRDILKEGPINTIPWINGVNSDEGLIYVANVVRNKTRRTLLNKNWKKFAPVIFGYEDHEHKDAISEKIKSYYLGETGINMATLKDSVNMFSDRSFFEDSSDSVLLQSKHSPVYAYYYAYQGEFSLANFLFARTGVNLPENLDLILGSTFRWISSNILRREQRHYGACHSDELSLFYNLPIIAREIGPGSKDYPLSQALIKIWTSFAKKGKPPNFLNNSWDPVQSHKKVKRLKIDKTPTMIDEPFASRILFWKTLNIET